MICSTEMFQLTRLPFELTRDLSILVYSACPGTSNFVRFSAMFELNHCRINAIPLYIICIPMAVANAQAGQALAGPLFSDNTLKLILLNPQ